MKTQSLTLIRKQMKSIITALFAIVVSLTALGQDLNCNVTVDYSQVEGSERTMFEAMERAIYEFINNRKWTSEVFKESERIEFNFQLNISEKAGDRYKASLNVQSRRPVFGSSYYTPVLNHQDENVSFNYSQFDVLDFSENNATQNNLTAIIAYYIYMVVGLDYDSFGLNGGTKYFNKALSIVNQNSGSQEAGWQAFESQTNRYWLVENHLEARFRNLRTVIYEYHRNGMDKMHENQNQGRTEITKALQKLEPVYQALPNSVNLRVFFNAKGDEIVNVFKEAPADEKNKIVALLGRIDPGNTTKWSKIKE